MDKPVVSVVLGSYNRKWLLQLCIESIRANGISVPYEIIVVDGGSTDGTLEWLIKQPDIITIVQHNRIVVNGKKTMKRGWGYFMNLGFKTAQGKYICMLNDDCIVHPDAIMNGYRLLEREEPNKVGGCAFYLRDYPRERHYGVGSTLGGKLFVNFGLYRRDATEEVGWIEEDYYQFYHADGDLGLKMWQHGYQIIGCSEAKVEHYVDPYSRSRLQNSEVINQKQDWSRYLERWTGIFYNPTESNTGGWTLLEGEANDHYAERFAQHKPFEPRSHLRRHLSRTKGFARGIVINMRTYLTRIKNKGLW